jgi:hypothetical protein
MSWLQKYPDPIIYHLKWGEFKDNIKSDRIIIILVWVDGIARVLG